MARCKLVDWTGKDVYPGSTFDSVIAAWDFLMADQHKQHPDASEKEFDEIMGEFATEELEVEESDEMSAEEEQGRRDADTNARYDASIDDRYDEALQRARHE